jgi:D-glycerate 3-kinase
VISDSQLNKHIQALIEAENLPNDFLATVEKVYIPLAKALAERHRDNQCLIVGVNGAQGTGKSTLTAFLSLLLAKQHGLPTASFSLDDIYLTKAQRRALASNIHPMLEVRGVPGTHDVALGISVIDQLVNAGEEQVTPIPAFDKAVDDRKPIEAWPRFKGRPAVIILEGWCVGSVAESEDKLASPMNALEEAKDKDATWRHYVNKQLDDSYKVLFGRFDVLIMIAAPNWDVVYQWRLLQEDKLRRRCQRDGLDDSAVMSAQQVLDFIQYYERTTRHCLAEMPGRADYLLRMAEDHRITGITGLEIE